MSPPSAATPADGAVAVGRPRPLTLVLERPDQLEEVARRLRDEGWKVRSGFELPAEPWDLRPGRHLAAGEVSDLASARAAIACLRRSAGLVVTVALPAEEADTFLADLHRLGEVRTEPSRRSRPSLPLNDDQRSLLHLVAHGSTVPEAAATLFLSPRTAERRLATARKALGVRSTAQAIALLLDEEASA